jgi:hypothetical protein
MQKKISFHLKKLAMQIYITPHDELFLKLLDGVTV